MKCQTTELELETIVNRIVNKDMDLQPDFQRGEIWPNQKKKKLIDSILRGWRIPPIHVVRNQNAVDEVLDGQQRLATIRDFYNNLFPVDGCVEPYDDEIMKLDGVYYKDLPLEYQRKFKQYSINIIRLTEFKPEEPAELFYRLNQPAALTSAEQRNAYIGITRNQVKALTNIFATHGITKELIGFSNSRLAYDEIVSKFCYAVEIQTLKKKITATDISNQYRNEIPFSDECIEIVGATIDKLLTCIKDLEDAKFYLNKATLYSWLIFVRQNLDLDNDRLKTVILNFEFCRSYIKGRFGIYREECMNIYKQMQEKLPFFELLLTTFNQRASMGNTDALAIIYRDIIINLFRDALLNVNSSLLNYYISEFANKENMNDILESIVERYGWGETYK